MADQWFFIRDGERFGPHSSQQLRHYADANQIRPDDYVWKEGMADWVTAKKIKGLFSKDQSSTVGVTATPPPFRTPKTEAVKSTNVQAFKREMTVRVQAPKTNPIGTAAKWITLGWTAFCFFGVVVGMLSAANSIANDPYAQYSDAAQAGQFIGIGLGLFIWLIIWSVIAIPGLVTWLLMRK